MRIVYFGTPSVAVPPLEALCAAGHDVALVVTAPDRRRGRRASATPSPVAVAATAAGIPVSHDPDDALGVGADLGVVVAYGAILGDELIEALSPINLHFSLLPRWRGAAPVERAILAGDRETGVCVMAIESTLDTGGIHERTVVPIGPEQTADELRDELSRIGAESLVAVLERGLGEPTPQAADGVTYASKLTSADRRIDWSGDAVDAVRVVRIARAWTTFRGRRLLVDRARVVADVTDLGPGELRSTPGDLLVGCGSGGAVALAEVRPEGRPACSGADFARGARLRPADALGD